MAITTVDDIAAGLAGAQDIDFIKNLTAPTIGAFQMAWAAPGFPGAGVTPALNTAGSGYTADNTTTGALPLANGAVQLWLARLAASCTQPGTILIYDRLWSCSFAAPVAAGTVSVTTPGNLPARITDNGVDVEAWLDVYAVGGASAGTATLNYLNANTGAAKSGPAFSLPSAPVVGRTIPFPLAAGDTGVRQITSMSNSATMTSGTYGLTLRKPLSRVPVLGVGLGTVYDWASLGLPKIPNGACLEILFLAQNATAPTIIGTMDIIDK